jgi:dCMP deaminase
VIIQAGIVEVVYLSDKYGDTEPVIASRRLFEAAGVACRQLEPARTSVTVSYAVE